MLVLVTTLHSFSLIILHNVDYKGVCTQRLLTASLRVPPNESETLSPLARAGFLNESTTVTYAATAAQLSFTSAAERCARACRSLYHSIGCFVPIRL